MRKIIFKDYDLAFIDTELTGRGAEHEIIEIGVVRVSGFNFSVREEWEIKLKPEHIENAEEESLRICHYSEDAWRDALDREEGMAQFLKKVEETALVGHNLTNDWYYLQKTLGECGLQPTFLVKSLDTVSLAWQKLRHEPKIQSFSLRELADYFGIVQENPHTALDDARTTYKIFIQLLAYQP